MQKSPKSVRTTLIFQTMAAVSLLGFVGSINSAAVASPHPPGSAQVQKGNVESIVLAQALNPQPLPPAEKKKAYAKKRLPAKKTKVR